MGLGLGDQSDLGDHTDSMEKEPHLTPHAGVGAGLVKYAHSLWSCALGQARLPCMSTPPSQSIGLPKAMAFASKASV